MKKLFFAFIFIFAAAMLSGCNAKRTRTVMFTENPPSLTTMTITTTSFVDTFSEYMATYSYSETDSESGGNPNTVSRPQGAVPDTAFSGGRAEQVSRDTAVVFTYVVTGEVSSYMGSSETTAVTEVPESETESTETSVAETAAATESSTVSSVTNNVPSDTALRDRPKRDTAFSQEITKDTAYSNSSYNENGGASNADQYTE